MALPATGWVSKRSEAAVTPVLLPTRASYDYRDAWVYPERQVRVRTIAPSKGRASAEAHIGAGDAGGVRAQMHIEDVHAVLLIDALLLEPPLEQGWAFNFDGHTFYVLNSVLGKSLVYDLTTGQWHGWVTAGEVTWNMHRGVVWKGRVLGADAFAPRVWELDTDSELDEGELPIERLVSGFQPVRGSASIRQGSLRLTARRDDPQGSALVRMRFSDDGGHTWSRHHEVSLLPGDGRSRIEYRSLGRIRAPGRLWEFSDAGGLVRIDGVDTDIDGGA